MFAAVANGLTRGGNSARERGIGNNAAVPHVLDQIVLAHHAVTVANEIEQKIENLRIDGDEIGAPAQFLPVDINCVIFEFIDQTIFSGAPPLYRTPAGEK